MRTKLLSVALAGVATIAVAQPTQPPTGETNGRGMSFRPDYTFTGSALTGWRPLAGSDWTAHDGEISVTAKADAPAKLLVFNQSFQDVGLRVLFQCPPEAEAGILFRMETNADGIKGILFSVKDSEVLGYNVTFDNQGKELSRESLGAPVGDTLARRSSGAGGGGGGRGRQGAVAPAGTNAPGAATNVARGGGRGGRGGRGSSIRPNEWNQLEIFLDLNIIRGHVNDGAPTARGATDSTGNGYGPIALFAGGNGQVKFKEVMCKDISVRANPIEKSSPRFHVQRLSDMYYSWAAAVADFNKDGVLDVVAGPYVYFGPDFTKYREIYPAFPFNPYSNFADVNCQYAFDFNGDGWPDVLTGPPNAKLYINPKGENRRWNSYVAVASIQSEVTTMKDIDGSGMPALIFAAGRALHYAKPDPSDATKPWIDHTISESGAGQAHGIGVGDINGDGKMDIVGPMGWWEQPAAGAAQGLWIEHAEAFARAGHRTSGSGGAVMGVYDVNGDKLNDVVTALNAHGFGLAWFEQKRDAAGKISFVRHMISDDFSTKNAGDVTFSEPHGSTFADIDGDGILDFVVGKRYWSHLDNYFDPDPYGDPVLYVYRTVRNPKAPGGAEFVPELIHNRSGAGSDVTAADLNHDGAVDVITSTDRGTFIFWNTPKYKTPK